MRCVLSFLENTIIFFLLTLRTTRYFAYDYIEFNWSLENGLIYATFTRKLSYCELNMQQIAFGLALKNRRLGKKLTQRELAEKAGMSEKTIQRIENNSDLRVSQYNKLLSALGITDLDIALDILGILGTAPADVAAASRLLTNESRKMLVKIIIEESRLHGHLKPDDENQ